MPFAQGFDTQAWVATAPRFAPRDETPSIPHQPQPTSERRSLRLTGWRASLLAWSLTIGGLLYCWPIAYDPSCLNSLNSLVSLEPILPPYAPAHEAHQAVLEELRRPEVLTLMVEAYADAKSIVDLTRRQLVECMANTTKLSTSPTFDCDPVILHAQLQEAILALQGLMKIYGSIKIDYTALNATTYRQGQPGPFSMFLVFMGDRFWTNVEYLNVTKNTLVPFENSQATRDKAQRGIAAVEKEVSRLEHILRVIQEVARKLLQIQRDTILKGCISTALAPANPAENIEKVPPTLPTQPTKTTSSTTPSPPISPAATAIPFPRGSTQIQGLAKLQRNIKQLEQTDIDKGQKSNGRLLPFPCYFLDRFLPHLLDIQKYLCGKSHFQDMPNAQESMRHLL
ncbi:MAG: hypothetical protein Q9222_003889 [Ikaeria aurantiellina]